MNIQDERFSSTFWTSAALAVAVLFGVFYAGRVTCEGRPIIGEDSCQYVLLSRSLLQGQGYRSIWIDGSPPHVKVPFGLPVMFSYLIDPGTMDLCRLFWIPVVFGSGALFLVFLLLRERAGDLAAWIMAVLTGANLLVYLYARSLLAEMPFLFFTLLALLFAGKVVGKDRPSWWWVWGLVAAVLMAFFTRAAGWFLVIAVIGALLLSSREQAQRLGRRQIITISAIVAPVILWSFACQQSSIGLDTQYALAFFKYHDPFTSEQRAMTFGGMIVTILKGCYALAFYALPSVLTNVVCVARTWWAGALSACVLIGFVRSWAGKPKVWEIYVLVSVAGLVLWPWVQTSGKRFIVPLIPLLFYYFYHGVCGAAEKLMGSEAARRVFIALILLPIAAVYVLQGPFIPRHDGARTDDAASAERAFARIRRSTPPGARFLSPTPACLYLYADRKAIFAPPSDDLSPPQVEALLRARRMDYVFDNDRTSWPRAILASYPGAVEKLWQDGAFRLFRVRKE